MGATAQRRSRDVDSRRLPGALGRPRGGSLSGNLVSEVRAGLLGYASLIFAACAIHLLNEWPFVIKAELVTIRAI